MTLLCRLVSGFLGLWLVGAGIHIYFLQARLERLERERAQAQALAENYQRVEKERQKQLLDKNKSIKESYEAAITAIDNQLNKRVREPAATGTRGVPASPPAACGDNATACLLLVRPCAKVAHQVVALQRYVNEVCQARRKP